MLRDSRIKTFTISLFFLLLNFSQNASASLKDGLVGYWQFGDESSSTAADSSGHGHSGSLKNGTIYSDDVPPLQFKNKQSLKLNGINQYVSTTTLGDFGSMMDTGPIAISFWVKTTSSGVFFIGSLNLGTETAFYVYLYDTGSIEWFVRGQDDELRAAQAIPTPALNNNKWRHVLVTKTGLSVSDLSIYVDGKLLDVTPYTQYGNVQGTVNLAFPVFIGAANNRGTPSGFTKGAMDEVRIYNRALTLREIQFLAAGYNETSEKSGIKLGPQFEQGKAVVGKVFNDVNGNGVQDRPQTTKKKKSIDSGPWTESGISGVKVVSDTGIYAITDEDGKYHFPFMETGQRVLKIDTDTLPEGALVTTDNPYKVVVTKGVLTKVSFGVKLSDTGVPDENSESQILQQKAPQDDKAGPLLKVSASQESSQLKPRLSVSAALLYPKDKEYQNLSADPQGKDPKVFFTIDCNYFLFIKRAELKIYDENQKLVKTLELPQPLPLYYELPLKDLQQILPRMKLPKPDEPVSPDDARHNRFYYQLSVFDAQNHEDRTSVGMFEIPESKT